MNANTDYHVKRSYPESITDPHPARPKISGIPPDLDPRHCFLSLQFHDLNSIAGSFKLNYVQL